MNNKKIKIFIVIIFVVLVAALVLSYQKSGNLSNKYKIFATCLKDKGAVFYGASWCPHCNDQKALFGSIKKSLPYIECSSDDESGQAQICKDKKIESYPTWIFNNEIKLTEVDEPLVCEKQPGKEGEDEFCEKISSNYGKVWLFSRKLIYSENNPLKEGDMWIFNSGSQYRGKLSLEELAGQTGCLLPQ
ncbi:MAG: hypothetical protein WCX46_01305 [Candidatus Paceibacterota bacterium]|jgi:glutaredoxin